MHLKLDELNGLYDLKFQYFRNQDDIDNNFSEEEPLLNELQKLGNIVEHNNNFKPEFAEIWRLKDCLEYKISNYLNDFNINIEIECFRIINFSKKLLRIFMSCYLSEPDNLDNKIRLCLIFRVSNKINHFNIKLIKFFIPDEAIDNEQRNIIIYELYLSDITQEEIGLIFKLSQPEVSKILNKMK